MRLQTTLRRTQPYGTPQIDQDSDPSPDSGDSNRRPRISLARQKCKEIPGKAYWFKWTAPGKVGNGNWYAGEIQTIHRTKIQWKWLDDNTLTTRTLGKLQHQSPEPITDIELQYLHGDSTLHRDEVRTKITSNTPQLPHSPQFADMCTEHQIGSLEGFWDTLNHKKWTTTLRWMEFEFDPTSF